MEKFELFIRTMVIVLAVGHFVSGTEVQAQSRTVIRTAGKKIVYTQPASCTTTVTSVKTLPAGAVVIRHNGLSYRYCAGRYYKYVNGKYVVVTAPLGLRVAFLPSTVKKIITAGTVYYYSLGTYYIKVDNVYQVVQAP